MHKVRVLKYHRNAVIDTDGKTVRRDCVPNEDIILPSIDMADIKSGLYRPYRQPVEALIIPQTVQRERQDENSVATEPVIASAILGLQKAINVAVDAIKLLELQKTIKPELNKEVIVNKQPIPIASKKIIITDPNLIPDDLFIDEGEETVDVYTQEALNDKTDIVNKAIHASIQDSSPERSVSMPNSMKKMPLISEANGMTDSVIQGEMVIDPVVPEPNDNTPVKLRMDAEGKLDVVATLGLQK